MTEQRSESSRPNAADPGSAQTSESWAARVYPIELERREADLVTGRRKKAEGSEGAAEGATEGATETVEAVEAVEVVESTDEAGDVVVEVVEVVEDVVTEEAPAE